MERKKKRIIILSFFSLVLFTHTCFSLFILFCLHLFLFRLCIFFPFKTDTLWSKLSSPQFPLQSSIRPYSFLNIPPFLKTFLHVPQHTLPSSHRMQISFGIEIRVQRSLLRRSCSSFTYAYMITHRSSGGLSVRWPALAIYVIGVPSCVLTGRARKRDDE